MKSYNELSKSLLIFLGIGGLYALVLIFLVAPIPASPNPLGETAKYMPSFFFYPFLTWITIWREKGHRRFCGKMATINPDFDARYIKHTTKKCWTCGQYALCIDWCYHWRCKECFNGFNRYWQGKYASAERRNWQR